MIKRGILTSIISRGLLKTVLLTGFIWLLLVDWLVIHSVVYYMLPEGGFLEVSVISFTFISAITIMPVVGLSRILKTGIEDNCFKGRHGQPTNKIAYSFVKVSLIVFGVFVILFIIMSISLADRFSVREVGLSYEFFRREVHPIAEPGDQNILLPAIITGLLPLLTTAIVLVIYFFVWGENTGERTKKEIDVL